MGTLKIETFLNLSNKHPVFSERDFEKPFNFNPRIFEIYSQAAKLAINIDRRIGIVGTLPDCNSFFNCLRLAGIDSKNLSFYGQVPENRDNYYLFDLERTREYVLDSRKKGNEWLPYVLRELKSSYASGVRL